eukprot:scaffold345_cov134-Cylindrotheca_fusiformis.AAC.59
MVVAQVEIPKASGKVPQHQLDIWQQSPVFPLILTFSVYPQPDKIPSSKVARDSKARVSPTSSPHRSTDDELLALRARNKVLTEALEAIKESASDEMIRRYDLVWFAKYRYRYPNHKESKRIDVQHKEEIEKLRSDDGDFHHGFNTGLLAAARMFREKADVTHINNFKEFTPDLLEEASKHKKKIQEARVNFPETDVTNDFPKKD